MSTKHTPGPWEWDGHTLRPSNPDPETSAVHSILDADGGYGFLGSDPVKTRAELEADITLIAAAPDLLQALQGLLDPATNEDGEWYKHAREAARAAIAKATGRTA